MALVTGTNCGFVTASPGADPGGGDTGVDGTCRAFQDTTPAGINTVTEIGFWADNTVAARDFDVAIYAENAGSPGAVVGAITTHSTAGAGGQWITATVSIPVSAATTYWIGVQWDDEAGLLSYNFTIGGALTAYRSGGQTALLDPFQEQGQEGNLVTVYAKVENVTTTGREGQDMPPFVY